MTTADHGHHRAGASPARRPTVEFQGGGPVADALRTGPFHHALSVAVRHRGLSLERLCHRLGEQGVHLSQATLSYWQTGRSQPERLESMRGLAILEEVLGVPPNSLARLVGSPRRRGRYPDDGMGEPIVRMWPSLDLARYAEELRLPERLELHAVAIDDRLDIREDGSEHTKSARQVLRAATTTRTHFDLTVVDDPAGGQPVVTETHGYTPVRINWAPESGLLVVEFILDRELAPGETAIVEHSKMYPSRARSSHWTRTFYSPAAIYTLEVTFAPNHLPERCYSIHRDKNAERLTDLAEVPLTSNGQAHAVFTNAPAGEYGLRWCW